MEFSILGFGALIGFGARGWGGGVFDYVTETRGAANSERAVCQGWGGSAPPIPHPIFAEARSDPPSYFEH